MRCFIYPLLGISLLSVGCGRDYKKIADRMVQERLLSQFEKTEAVAFFESEGRFFDKDGTSTVDRDIVLPLLKRLNEVAQTEQWVMLKPQKADKAIALLVELPKQTKLVDQMAAAVEAADAEYSGLIIQQWGRAWLQMALVDEQTAEYLKKNDPDVEKQR